MSAKTSKGKKTSKSSKVVATSNPRISSRPIILSEAGADKVVKSKVKKPSVDLPIEHENYFVYLRDPLEYRRNLLESSRKILCCLKSHQKILLIRQKKLEEIKSLKASIRELLYINKKFNERLPKLNAAFLEGHNAEPKKQKPAIPVNAIPIKKPSLTPAPSAEKSELDKLEDSLAMIEQKLSQLK